jgi:hypothetical protein
VASPHVPRNAWRRHYERGAGPVVRNKANLPSAGRNRRGPARSPAPLGQSVRNKANSTGATRRTSALWKKGYDELGVQKALAKQSQFPGRDGWPARPRFYPARVPLPHPAHKQSQLAGKANFRMDRKGQEPARLPVPPVGAIVGNKANLPAPATKRRWRAGPRQNKANFRGSGRPDGPGIRHRMGATPLIAISPTEDGRSDPWVI